MAMPCLFAFYLPRVLVPDRRKIEDTVKKPVQRVKQVDPTNQVNRFYEQAFRLHEFPQMLFCRANGPQKICCVPLFDLRFCPVPQANR